MSIKERVLISGLSRAEKVARRAFAVGGSVVALATVPAVGFSIASQHASDKSETASLQGHHEIATAHHAEATEQGDIALDLAYVALGGFVVTFAGATATLALEARRIQGVNPQSS